MKKSKRRKRRATPMEVDKIAILRGIPHFYSAFSGFEKLPSAAYEGCVLVPFHLASFIPESAVRKFAAQKPFIVEVRSPAENSISFYGKCRHWSPFNNKDCYRITGGKFRDQ